MESMESPFEEAPLLGGRPLKISLWLILGRSQDAGEICGGGVRGGFIGFI